MLRRPGTSDFRTARTGGIVFKRTVRTLLSPEQLNQAIMRESARVDRRGDGTLSLVLFRLPATAGGRRSRRRMGISAVRLARTILKRIRVTDDVGWFDDQHLGVLMPDTPPAPGDWRRKCATSSPAADQDRSAPCTAIRQARAPNRPTPRRALSAPAKCNLTVAWKRGRRLR